MLAINKMDLVGYSEAIFNKIVEDYTAFARQIGIEEFVAIPVSGLRGDNIKDPSEHTDWYHGPTLMGYLETVDIEDNAQQRPLRMPVQWVNRPNLDFRGFAGTIASGMVRQGDKVRVLPSGRESTVTRIVTMDGDLEHAIAGQAITLTLADEIDISRGDVIARPDDLPGVADQFEAVVVWMSDEPMLPGRPYWLKIGTKQVSATITEPKYKVNVNTLEHLAAKKLELNEIGICNVSLDQPIAFDPYHAVPRDRLVHPDRPAHQCHGRRGHDPLCPAPFAEHPLAGARREHEVARGVEGPAACGAVADGPVGRRQVDDRQPGREAAAGPRQAHLPARRRQRPPRLEP